MYGYIYKTTNLLNGKIYVGMHHGNFDPLYRGSGKLLKYAVRKYGVDSFKVEMIQECFDQTELDAYEIYWISFYNSTDKNIGYNILAGGINGYQNNVQSARKGQKLPQETCLKMSIATTGVKKSKSHCQHIRESMLAKHIHLSEETKSKISQTLKAHSPVRGSVWIKNMLTSECKKVSKEIAVEYMNNGWIPGRVKTWKNQYEK